MLNWKEVLIFLEESNKIEREYSQEALNDARHAFYWAVKNIEEVFTMEHVLGIHFRLMENLNPYIAGQFRDCDVTIGGRLCPFISHALLKEEVQKVLDVMNESIREYRTEERYLKMVAKRCHILFEKVHPFFDGNGRAGRILYNMHRLRLGLPIHTIYTGEDQLSYYEWFK